MCRAGARVGSDAKARFSSHISSIYDVNYQGRIDYAHIMRLTTDGSAGSEYIASWVGYMRGIIRSLEAVRTSD